MKSEDPHVFLIDTGNNMIKLKLSIYQSVSISVYKPMKFEASGLLKSCIGRIKGVKKIVENST